MTAEFIDLVQYDEIREGWTGLYRKAFIAMADPAGALVGKQPPASPVPAKPLLGTVSQSTFVDNGVMLEYYDDKLGTSTR